MFVALKFSTEWCCNNCDDEEDIFLFFFPGKLLYKDSSGQIFYGHPNDKDRRSLLTPTQAVKSSLPKRSTKQTVPLRAILRRWRRNITLPAAFSLVWPPHFILGNADIKELAAIHPDCVKSSRDIARILDKSEEWHDKWAAQIYLVVEKFDVDLKSAPKRTVPKKRRRAGVKATPWQEAEDEYEDGDGNSDDGLERALMNIRNRKYIRACN
jgi:hypothetical protein